MKYRQHRLGVGTIEYTQAIFRGTSPAQLHLSIAAHISMTSQPISGVDHADKHNLVHILGDINIRPKTISFVREHHPELEHLIQVTSSPASSSGQQAHQQSQQTPRAMDIDDGDLHDHHSSQRGCEHQHPVQQQVMTATSATSLSIHIMVRCTSA